MVLAVARTAAGLSVIASTYAALVFAVLPLHAESVAWITGRVDTIPALFFLGSFLAYASWRRNGERSTRLYVYSIVLFFCALFSKQNTIVMVAALVLYDHGGRASSDPSLVVVGRALRSVRGADDRLSRSCAGRSLARSRAKGN